MNNRLPGNLDEIFPLRFRLRDELRFFRGDGSLIAERVSKAQRYSLKSWQFEMLNRFDGKHTFEELAKQVYSLHPGAFTAMGLLNFYNWLYDENLVLCECDSVFELVSDDSNSDEKGASKLSVFASQLLQDSRVRRVMQVSVILVFSLSVFRLAFVAAPIFEPPVNRLASETGKLLRTSGNGQSIAKSERSAPDTSVEAVELASKVEVVDPPKPPVEKQVDVGVSPEPAPPAPQSPPAIPDEVAIEALRTELEECRIRRDEFYFQNDEEGYRQEVHRMTNLVKEIGDIENRLQ